MSAVCAVVSIALAIAAAFVAGVAFERHAWTKLLDRPACWRCGGVGSEPRKGRWR